MSRDLAPPPLTDTGDLFAARAASVRRRVWQRRAILVLALVAVAALTWLIAFSPVLAARSVVVTGLDAGHTAQGASITAAARVPLGTALVRISTGAIAERVERLSTVESVTVTRSWPGTIVVDTRLKTPVLALKNPESQVESESFDVLAADGSVIQRVIAAPDGVPLAAQGAVAATPEGVRAALGFLSVLDSDERATVSSITLSGASVTARMGGTTVIWGDGSRPDAKKRVLDILTTTKKVRVIDVTAPDSPVTR